MVLIFQSSDNFFLVEKIYNFRLLKHHFLHLWEWMKSSFPVKNSILDSLWVFHMCKACKLSIFLGNSFSFSTSIFFLRTEITRIGWLDAILWKLAPVNISHLNFKFSYTLLGKIYSWNNRLQRSAFCVYRTGLSYFVFSDTSNLSYEVKFGGTRQIHL